MFTVVGETEGRPYRLSWDDGALDGDDGAIEALTAAVGRTVSLPPTGPSAVLDLTDPVSVLIGCHDVVGGVDDATGDVPDVQALTADDDAPEDAVY